VAAAIEKSIKDTYQEFGQIYQAGMCPHAELLYGIKASGDVLLYCAYGPVVNEVDGFRSGGSGYARPSPTRIGNVSGVPLKGMFYAMLDVLQEPKSITESGKIPIGPQADSPHEETHQNKKRFVIGGVVRQHISISRTDDNQEPEKLRTLGETGIKLLRNCMVVLG
jgi:hypothetical protein